MGAAHARDSARGYGKSDPIDALAIARAAAREPDLPVAHLDEVARVQELTRDIRRLETELVERTRHAAPALLQVHGVAVLSAAKIIGEVAGVARFRSRHAFARHNGTAPLPVWSGNRRRHRLSRTGNRQLNAALHRIAVTQARAFSEAIAYLERRQADGNTRTEAVRALKRRLSDVVYRALLADAAIMLTSSRPAVELTSE